MSVSDEKTLRWPTTVTAKYNSSRQNKICHGKIKFITAKYNLSRQNTIYHGKIQFITAKNNSKQQIQITPGKLQTLTAKAKTIIAIQNSSRQEQNAHGVVGEGPSRTVFTISPIFSFLSRSAPTSRLKKLKLRSYSKNNT